MNNRTASIITRRYETLSTASSLPEPGCTTFIVRTEKGRPKAVTSFGAFGLTIGDYFDLVVDTQGSGYRSYRAEIIGVGHDGGPIVSTERLPKTVARYFAC